MGMQIQDGKGTQRLAEVDSEFKLMTRSVTSTELGHASIDEEVAFTAYLRHAFVAADTNENVAHIQNHGTGNIVIDQITFSTNTATSMKIELFFIGDLTSGGTERTPLNLNRGSKVTSDLHAHYNDGSSLLFTTTAANEFLDIRLSSGQNTFTFDFKDALILAPDEGIAFVGEAGAIGDKVRLNVYYYEAAMSTGHGGH